MVRWGMYIIVAYLSRPGVALLGESDVTDALVVWVHLEVPAVGDVVEVLYFLMTKHMPRFSPACQK